MGGTLSRSEIEPRFLNFPACDIVEICTESVQDFTTCHLKPKTFTVLNPELEVSHNSFLLPLLSATPSKTEIRTSDSSLYTQTDKQ